MNTNGRWHIDNVVERRRSARCHGIAPAAASRARSVARAGQHAGERP